jgi:copper chaperone CopZ
MKTTFLIEGMTCEGCEGKLSQVVSTIKGIRDSQANFKTSTLTVDYDPSTASIDEIKNAVQRVGYRFAAVRPSIDKRESSDEAIA